MRNIISNSIDHSKVRTLVLSALIIAANPVLAAEDNFSGESKSTVSKYQGISTATFESLSFYPKRTAPAKVEAINISKISAQIPAKLNKILVKTGALVKSGETLAKLECIDYQSRLTTANSMLNQTKQQLSYETKELKRAIKVEHNSSLSQSEIDRRQTVVNNLKSSLNSNEANQGIAQQNVNRCNIESPFYGLVIKRIANDGEMLVAGAPIVEIVQLNQSEISATISISQIASFKNAESYKFVTNGMHYSVELKSILNFISNNSSSQQARLKFIDSAATIGATGLLTWNTPQLHLPAYLLSKRDGKTGVFILNKDSAEFVVIKNAEEGRPFHVELKATDKIILDGRHKLLVNQKLNPINNRKQQ